MAFSVYFWVFFVLCDHSGEGSLQKDLLVTDISTTWAVAIFRVKWRFLLDDGIYASGHGCYICCSTCSFEHFITSFINKSTDKKNCVPFVKWNYSQSPFQWISFLITNYIPFSFWGRGTLATILSPLFSKNRGLSHLHQRTSDLTFSMCLLWCEFSIPVVTTHTTGELFWQ